ncbi:MAG: heavy metal-binding domain-containing protein [Patescibacteria group bacterium]
MVYTCPMHPEIARDQPGACPKCGMALVPSDKVQAMKTMDRGLGPITWKSYLPLIGIFAAILFVSILVGGDVLLHFMTGFFLVFSAFKLIDLKGFAEGYSTYDLLASRVKIYGFVYPFIELGFGLAMLFGFHSSLLFIVELVVMGFSGIGVAIKIAKHEKFQCVCLGTFLKVPLTTVTLVEDFGMAFLALVMLFR